MGVRRAILFSYVDKYFVLLIHIASTLVLARILTPAEVGVFAIASVLVSFAGIVRDLNAGEYIVQERELTSIRIQSAFGLALGLGAILGAAALSLGPLAARFYSEPEVRDVLWILALNFFIVPFGSISQALLARELRFGELAIINVTHATTQASVTVTLALLGWGVLSLAWGSVAAAIVSALLTNRFRPAGIPWMPTLREIGRVARFGTMASSANFVQALTDNFSELAIGRSLGMTATGLFGRARGFVSLYQQLVMRAIAPVSFAYMSQCERDGQLPSVAIKRLTVLVMAVAWPGLAFMGVFAGPLIEVLFGPQWMGSVSAAQWLAAAAAISSLSAFVSQALLARGLAHIALRLAAAGLVVRVVMVVMALPYGIVTIAAAVFGSTILTTGFAILVSRRYLTVALRTWWGPIFQSALLVTASIIPALIVRALWPAEETLLLLLVAASFAFGGYLFCVWTIKHPVWVELVGFAKVSGTKARAYLNLRRPD